MAATEMNELYDISYALILYLQSFSPTLDAPMLAFSFLGTSQFYLLLFAYIYWLVDPRLGPCGQCRGRGPGPPDSLRPIAMDAPPVLEGPGEPPPPPGPHRAGVRTRG